MQPNDHGPAGVASQFDVATSLTDPGESGVLEGSRRLRAGDNRQGGGSRRNVEASGLRATRRHSGPFSLDLVARDLDLILGLARRLGVRMGQGDVTAAITGQAIEDRTGRSRHEPAVYLREAMKR